ncbi:MAG: hypothetical protein FH748_17360 [Balneolaceae bacterium]|nr:hypothetical protein [Balneolaceae bacterium]
MKTIRYPLLLPIIIISLVTFSCSDSPPEEVNAKDGFVNNPTWGKYQDSENPPVQLVLEDSIKVQFHGDDILTGFTSLITDSNGNFYFLDRRQNKLISASPDGSVRWVTGQKGRGPGDFEYARNMIIHDDVLLISNLSGSRLDRFDLSGNFIASQPFDKETSFASLVGITSQDVLVINSFLRGALGSNIYTFDYSQDSLQLINNFEIDQSGDLEIPKGVSAGIAVQLVDEFIIAGSTVDYSLTTYNLEGKLIKKITRDFDKIVRPGFYSTEQSRGIRTFGGLGSAKVFPNGYFIVEAFWPTNVSDPDKIAEDSHGLEIINRNSTDFYDPDGTLLYSITGEGFSPERGTIKHIDPYGNAYKVKTDPEPTIYSYKLKVPEED